MTILNSQTFADHCNRCLRAVGLGVAAGGGPPRVLTSADFPDRSNEPMRKFVSLDTWENYLKIGAFQLATPKYYRETSNLHIQDSSEGLSTIIFAGADKQVTVAVDVSANVAVFCGSRSEGADPIMNNRFGEVVIEIRDTQAFANCIAAKIGANKSHVHDVIYADGKVFRHPLNVSVMRATLGTGNLTDETLKALNTKFFWLFKQQGLYGSVFSKPISGYELERERRIAFELPSDVTGGVIRFTDPELLGFITRIA